MPGVDKLREKRERIKGALQPSNSIHPKYMWGILTLIGWLCTLMGGNHSRRI
jgi:hypothetical protein